MGKTIQQVAEDVPDDPLTIHHIGHPTGHQPEGLGNPKAAAKTVVPIDQQGEVQAMACGEAAVADGVITTDAPDLGSEFLEGGAAVAKAACLCRATRRVVLGVKEQNQPTATCRLGSSLHSILIVKTEAGQGVADADGHLLSDAVQTISRAALAPSETIGLGIGSVQMADQLTLLEAVPEHRSEPTASAGPATLLIIDTETTGLDPEKDRCLEVGAILFDVSTRSVLAQQSFLLPVETNAAEPINRIPASVTRLPQPWTGALRWFDELLSASDVLVAHNAAFDRQWFGRDPLPAVSHPWLCSMEDLRGPADRQLRSRPSVRDLALAYGVPVWSAHRALTDCIYLAEVFARCDDLETMLLHGLEPRQLMRARVSYDDRHLARDAGFRWNDPVKGAWTRRLSQREVKSLDFPVEVVEPGPERRAA